MAYVDASILSEIKARIDLADLISEYGIDLHRTGSSAKACCPFHTEKTPSFHVNSEKGFYKCFGCGEGGDAFSFVQKYEGIPFIEALRKLAERAGVKLDETYDPQSKIRSRLYQINAEVAQFYRRCLLKTREAEEARAYLEKRDLAGEIAERFAIGYAPLKHGALLEWAERHAFSPEELVASGLLAPPRTEGADYYDRFRGRIVFPICDVQGRVIAFSCRLLHESKHTGKYVNSPETAIFKKSNTLYALHLARSHISKAVPRRAIVCEGQIDVIRCHACGFEVAVASQGTAFTAEHVALLKRYADTADLVFDGDGAGTKAALRTMGLFLSAGMPVRIATLPAGEDPDSLLRTQGASAFRSCLDSAEDPAPYLVKKLRAQEASPDAMDATMRIAKTAVATVVDCPEPVLTARFLQDVASALHLPFETLQHDLDALRADAELAAKRREAFLAKQEEGNPRPRVPELADESSPIYDTSSDEEWVSEDSPLDEPEESPVRVPSLGELETSQNLAEALCELLVHHFSDEGVMDCLIRHLPQVFVHAPFASKLYGLAVTASLAGQRVLEPPKDDPAFTETLSRLALTPDRISADSELTPLTFAQDLVRNYWLAEYDQRSRALPETSMEAYEMKLSRKRLQALSWQEAEPFMDALHPTWSIVAEAVKPSAPAEPTPQTPEPDPAPPEEEVSAPTPPPIPSPAPPEGGDIFDAL